jgi:hypothetical protein
MRCIRDGMSETMTFCIAVRIVTRDVIPPGTSYAGPFDILKSPTCSALGRFVAASFSTCTTKVTPHRTDGTLSC